MPLPYQTIETPIAFPPLPPSTLVIETPRAFLPLLRPARYKGARGGRGSAKSHFFAEMLIEDAISINGFRAVCIREYQRSLDQSVKLLLEDKIKSMGVSNYFSVRNSYIETKRDGIIIFQGMQSHNADSIKSLENYQVAWVEEAQTLSQRSLDLLRPTIRAKKSELRFSWNPTYKTDPVEVFFCSDPPPPDSVCVTVDYRDNPKFPNVLMAEMLWDRANNPDKYKHIWLGKYEENSEARVFKNWRIGTRAEIDDAVRRVGMRTLQGADWGYANDPSVLVRLVVDQPNRVIYITHEAYRLGVEIDHTPQLFDQVPEARKWVTTADSARPETISWMQRNGYPRMRAAKKGPNSVSEGVEFIKMYQVVIDPSCTHVIDEFTLYSYEIDKLTGLVLPILRDDKNHTIDSVRYALESLRVARIGLY